MIVLLARYYVRAGKREQVEHILAEMAEKVRSNERDCALYEVSRSAENPELLLLYERYPDMAAVEGHRSTPHYHALIEGKVLPLLERRERELFEVAVM